jgi:tetratricopeptide (TPR) repeat protein
MTHDARVSEQIAILREEIDDLDAQVAAGDINSGTADKLRVKYLAELDELDSVGTVQPASEGDPPPETSGKRSRVSGRVLTGAAVLGAAIVAIGVFAVLSLDSDGIAGAEGIAGDVLSTEGGVDLADITNEQMEDVVAANPDVIGMRLALARRYFEEGSFDRALDHYFEVLEREQHPEALANVGWMTYLSSRPDVAVGYLEAALERQPDYLPAKWFIANVDVSLDRVEEALPLLVEIAGSDEVPQEVKEGALTLLRQIEESP